MFLEDGGQLLPVSHFVGEGGEGGAKERPSHFVGEGGEGGSKEGPSVHLQSTHSRQPQRDGGATADAQVCLFLSYFHSFIIDIK